MVNKLKYDIIDLTGTTVVSQWPQSMASPVVTPAVIIASRPDGTNEIEGTRKCSNSILASISFSLIGMRGGSQMSTFR